MKRFSQRHLSVLAEINVTPLLDLAFVLLIIFIITTPLFEQAIGVNLAKAAKAAEQQKVPRGRTVSIDKAGQLYIDRSPVDFDMLKLSMSALANESPDAAVLVRVDKQQQFEKFVQVIDVLKGVGITRVGIVALTEERKR